MDLTGSRHIRLKPNEESKTVIRDSEGKIVKETEELTDEQIEENGYSKEEIPYNEEEIKTIENYKRSQKVVEKRLEKLGIDNYIIKLDEQTGEIVIELTENDKTDSTISNISTTGKFEIVDSQTEEVLMDNNDIKSAKVMYGSGSSTTSNGTTVYLSIEFNKDGKRKLEEISKMYVKTENTEDNESEEENSAEEENLAEEENTEENTEENETTEKKITMKIDDEEIMSTSFDETIKTGKLQLSIGKSATDKQTLQEYINRASNMANVLDTGKVPVKYDLEENKYISSDITDNEIAIIIYVILAIVVILIITLIVKYKMLGILGTISYIGFISSFMILIRYANVVVSLEGIFGIITVFILNYILINKLLKKSDKRIDAYKEFFAKIIPVIIMTITFCFIKWNPVSSFGMVMFWGITLIGVYNSLVTNSLLKINAGKEK